MLDEVDEVATEEVRTVRPAFIANRLAKAGEYAQAKALLEGADFHADDTAAMLYIMVLDKMGAQAEKQAAVERLIEGLGATPECSDTLLTYLLRQAQRACLPSEPVEKLLQAAEARERAGGDLDMVYRAVKRRHIFREKQAPRTADLRLISLGTACLPWTLLNRWGMRDRAQFTGDFNPFCLATHKPRGMIAALENDFATYLAPDEITVEKVGRKQPFARRIDGSVNWNHNQGTYWTQNDCAALRDVMQSKIENFRRSCRDRTPVFIISGPPTDADEIDYLPRLRLALSQFTGRDNDYVIITSQSLKSPREGVVKVDDNAFMFYCPYPSEDYSWFVLDVADSPEGLEFERKYMKFLLQCLKRWDLLKPRKAGLDDDD